MDQDAGIGGICSTSQSIVFVVFSISDDQDDLTGLTLFVEGVRAQCDGAPNSGALQGDRFRTRGVQKQLDRGQVQSQGGLHIGVSGEDHQADTVSIQLFDNAFYRSLGQV